ncbi:hypothetical protein [Streptomyces sp. NPDC050534]|uniref:hypothetical protein n=1 Tax=Streptomyces sp. NPDC050534 TaxID=3365625 RepID=UPI0037B69FAF
MTMRARPYLHCAPVPGGVYFSGARTQFVLKGWEHLFKVADVCLPLLEQGTTEDELVAALGSERARSVVRQVTQGLREHGMLLEEEMLGGPEPSSADRERYAGSLAYAESVCADPYSAFARLRTARVAVCGQADAARSAARGLGRAGVGEVLMPEVTALGACGALDAVLYCGTDDELRAGGFDLHGARRILAGVPVVPVLVHDRVLQAGPVVRGADGDPVPVAVRHRVLGWARGEELGPAARPVADAMIGAIAGQLAVDVLLGIGEAGAAHVVHGGALVAERILLGSPTAVDGLHRLDDAPADAAPDADAAIERVNVLTARWKGLYTPAATEQTLSQMPLAVREMELRTGTPGRVTVWAQDQWCATVGAALEVLRSCCPAADGASSAAGLTEERWLLDGALRLLADEAEATRTDVVESEETARIRRILRECRPEPLTVRVLHVPGLDWRLARVRVSDSGQLLGAAWAPDGDAAVREALSTALAAAQVQATRGGEAGLPLLRTDAVNIADQQEIHSLRTQLARLAAARDVSFQGHSRRADHALGDLPFWCGPVRAQQHTQETRHAR